MIKGFFFCCIHVIISKYYIYEAHILQNLGHNRIKYVLDTYIFWILIHMNSRSISIIIFYLKKYFIKYV